MPSAVKIDGVSKRFRLYQEQYSSLKERMIHFGKIPFEEFWALSDVDLQINEGETFGLLGHNGSGKSTLLKIVAGILTPTSGEVRVRGRLAALLELGAGFHPDLTGRENVFMNGTLLGFSRKQMEARLEEIVAFAELEQFIDNQVKHYSSGMYVRLGFAVAVNLDPDVLLVDEVLAVGDENFQRKCIERVKQFQREGRTIVVVTHAADMVRQICDRAAVLDHGIKVAEGTPGEAIRTYREYLMDQGVAIESTGDAGMLETAMTHGESQKAKALKVITITDVEMKHSHQDERAYLLPGEGLDITLDYTATEKMDDVVFGVAVYDLEGRVVFGWNTDKLGIDVPPIDGKGRVRFAIASVPLLDGDYMVTVAAHDQDGGVVYDWHDQEYRFEVMNPGTAEGLVFVPPEVTLTSLE